MTSEQARRTDQVLTRIVEITEHKRNLERQIDHALEARAVAFGALRANSGLSVQEIAQQLRDRLVARGWTPDEIKGAGVGYHSILRAT